MGHAAVAAALGYQWPVWVVMAATGIGAAYAADYIHTGLHLRNFWMERFALFRELRRLHVFHHKGDFLTNFGVYDLSLDMVYGSFKWV